MSNWVWSVTQTNWPTVKSKKVWVVTSAGKDSMVKDGDMFIFYVKGKSWFQGIYKVVGDWHAPAFMNAEGRDILIGVDDEGNPLGLERDYSTFNDASADRFEQHLTNLITKYLGRIANTHLKTRFHKIDGKEICRCKVKKASGPVYLEKNGNKKFYVRLNNTAQPLNVEQTYNYITEHWN